MTLINQIPRYMDDSLEAVIDRALQKVFAYFNKTLENRTKTEYKKTHK